MSRIKEDIVAKPVRSDHVDTYGPWAWIAGFVFAVLITWMMFYIADGFS
jgi:small basic protein